MKNLYRTSRPKVDPAKLDVVISDLIERKVAPLFDDSPGMVTSGLVAGLVRRETKCEIQLLSATMAMQRLGWIVPKEGALRNHSIHFSIDKRRRHPSGLVLRFKSTVTPIVNPAQAWMFKTNKDESRGWDYQALRQGLKDLYSESDVYSWWTLEGDPLETLK
jgi:hypothetical protein